MKRWGVLLVGEIWSLPALMYTLHCAYQPAKSHPLPVIGTVNVCAAGHCAP